MLVASLLTMGVATVLIGLLPTYESIGVMAPILLCFLRFVQGIGLGGEWGGAALIATEFAPKGRRGLFGALPQLGSAPGFLLSNGIFLGLSLFLPNDQFLSWGWRVPFLLSSILIIFGLYIRLSIAETPVFQRVLEKETQSSAPIVTVLKTNSLQVVLGGMSTAITYVLFFTTGTFGLSYGVNTLGMDRSHMLSLTMVAVIAMAVSTLVCGMLGDRFGRPRVIMISGAIAVVWSFFFFPMLDTKDFVHDRGRNVDHAGRDGWHLRTDGRVPAGTFQAQRALHRVGSGLQPRRHLWRGARTHDRVGTGGAVRFAFHRLLPCRDGDPEHRLRCHPAWSDAEGFQRGRVLPRRSRRTQRLGPASCFREPIA